MWSSSHHYSLIQQGNGNLEAESEESEVSQDSFRGETEHLELWSRIQDEAEKCHETQLNALIDRSILSKRRFMARIIAERRKEKRAEESALGVSKVRACCEERFLLPKSDGNPKRAQR